MATAEKPVANEFDPLSFDDVVVSASELANGGENADKLMSLLAWQDENGMPLYANYDISDGSGGVPEGYEVVGSVYTTGRGENAEPRGAMVVCVPSLDTVLAAPDGHQFAADKVRKNHLLKVQTAIRTDPANPSFPKSLQEFLATRRTANEGLQVAKDITKGVAKWLRANGMSIDQRAVEACFRSRKHSLAVFGEDQDRKIFKPILDRAISQVQTEGRDASQLISWRDTRDTFDPAAQIGDLDLTTDMEFKI